MYPPELPKEIEFSKMEIGENTYWNEKSPVVFLTTHHSYFTDLDPYGHMNTECYLSYFIRHRFEGMKKYLGLGFNEIAQLPIMFVVKKVSLEYMRSIQGDENFSIRSFICELRRCGCIVDLEMRNEASELVAKCKMEIVCIDSKSQKVSAWPSDVLGLFYKD